MKQVTLLNGSPKLIWQLGSALTRAGYPVTLVDLDPHGALTQVLMRAQDPLARRVWTQSAGTARSDDGGLADVAGEALEAVELRDDPGLALLPAGVGQHSPEAVEQANQRLAAWLDECESDIALLCATGIEQASAWPVIERSALAMLRARLNAESLQQFRETGEWLQRCVSPARVRYLVTEPRFRGHDPSTAEFVAKRLPRVFRETVLQGSAAARGHAESPATDPLCVGRIIERDDPVPTLRLPPGSGDAPDDLRTARHRLQAAALNVLAALGLSDEALTAPG